MPSSLSLRRTLLPALLAAALAAPTAFAQQASGDQVIRSWIDEVKLDDGSVTTWTVTLTYNATTGEYARTAVDASGAVVDRLVTPYPIAAPNEAEIERARALILADPELRALYEAATNPVLSGGFVLSREDGHPCGPGSRCLQFDLYDVNDAAREVNRIRFVIVDARDFSVVDADFDPRHGNATRFNR